MYTLLNNTFDWKVQNKLNNQPQGSSTRLAEVHRTFPLKSRVRLRVKLSNKTNTWGLARVKAKLVVEVSIHVKLDQHSSQVQQASIGSRARLWAFFVSQGAEQSN